MERDKFSPYYDRAAIERSVAAGHHREVVGGMWEEIGTLQFEFLKECGLRKHHRLLDIGCGSLRGGVHFVQYLAPSHYFGIDMNQSLIEAGYEREIMPSGLAPKLPMSNLRCVSDFEVSTFGVRFDFALALSVFTHLPLNSVRICLERVADAMVARGKFYATIFELPDDKPTWMPQTHPPAGVTTHGASDPYHYRLSDMRYAAAGLPWTVRYTGQFGHPRGQRMIAFERRTCRSAASRRTYSSRSSRATRRA